MTYCRCCYVLTPAPCYHPITMIFRQANQGSFPDKKAIAGEMAKKAELKKYMKKIMPFVSTVMEKVSGVVASLRRDALFMCHSPAFGIGDG